MKIANNNNTRYQCNQFRFPMDRIALLLLFLITKKREKKYTIAELIGKYRRLRKKEKYKNSEITMEDFCRETFINSKLIIDIFETWEDFCEMSTIIHWQKITIYNT